MKQDISLKKVVFLDRDGVINYDSAEYIKNWNEFNFIPGSIEGIKNLTENGFVTIIITNQSAVKRNLISLEDLERIHSKMLTRIKKGKGKIQDIFFCHHLPSDNCPCRKPKPGLIFKAQKKYIITLSDTIMVGDSAKDIICANKAGCGKAVLVKTGNGIKAKKILQKKMMPPDWVAENLYDAVQWILLNDVKT